MMFANILYLRYKYLVKGIKTQKYEIYVIITLILVIFNLNFYKLCLMERDIQ